MGILILVAFFYRFDKIRKPSLWEGFGFYNANNNNGQVATCTYIFNYLFSTGTKSLNGEPTYT